MSEPIEELTGEAVGTEPAEELRCDANKRERKGYSLLRRMLAHLQLAASVVVLTCFIIDKFNSSMGFMENKLTKAIVAVLAALTFITSIMTIVAYWPRGDA